MGRKATVVEVSSDSTPGRTYMVWVGAEGPIFCNCPGHKYARHGVRKPCKHMRALGSATEIVSWAQTIATTKETVPVQSTDRRFRFLEVQEETTEGTWATVSDLRFRHLEV